MKLLTSLLITSSIISPTLPVVALFTQKNNKVATSEDNTSQTNSILSLNDYNYQFKEFLEHRVNGIPYAYNINQDYLNNILFPKRTYTEVRTSDVECWAAHSTGKRWENHSIDFQVSPVKHTPSDVSIGGKTLDIIPLFHTIDNQIPSWMQSTGPYDKSMTDWLKSTTFVQKLGKQYTKPCTDSGTGGSYYNLCGGHWAMGSAGYAFVGDAYHHTTSIFDWTREVPEAKDWRGRNGGNFIEEMSPQYKYPTLTNSGIFNIIDYNCDTIDDPLSKMGDTHIDGGVTYFTCKNGHTKDQQVAAGFHDGNDVRWGDAWFFQTQGQYHTWADMKAANNNKLGNLMKGVIPNRFYAWDGGIDGIINHCGKGITFLTTAGANTNLAEILDYSVDNLLQLSYVGFNKATNKYYLNIQLNDEILAAALGQQYNKQLQLIFNKDFGNLKDNRYWPEEWKEGGNCWIDWNSHFYFHDILGISNGDAEFKGGTNTWVPHRFFTTSKTEEWSTNPETKATEQQNYANFCAKLQEFIKTHLFKNDNYQIHYDNYLKFKWFVNDYWNDHTPDSDWINDFMVALNTSNGSVATNGWFEKAIKYKMTEPNIDYCYYLALILPQLKISTWINEALDESGWTHPNQDKFIGSDGKTYATGYDLLEFGNGQNKGLVIELDESSKITSQDQTIKVRFNGESLKDNYQSKNVMESLTNNKAQGQWHGCINNVDKLSLLTDFDGTGGAIKADDDNETILIKAQGKMAQSSHVLEYYGLPIQIEPKAGLSGQTASSVWTSALSAAGGDKIAALKSIFVDNYEEAGVPKQTPACPIVTFNMYDWSEYDYSGTNLPKNTQINVQAHDKYGELKVKLDQVNEAGEIVKNLTTFYCFDFKATPSQNISFVSKSKATDKNAVTFKGKFKKTPIDNLAQVALINKEGSTFPLKLTQTSLNVDAEGNFAMEVQYENIPSEKVTSEFSVEFTYNSDEGEEYEKIEGLSVVYDKDLNDFVIPLPGQSTEVEAAPTSKSVDFTFSINKSTMPDKTIVTASDSVLIRDGISQPIVLPVTQTITTNSSQIKVTVDLSGFEHKDKDIVKYNLTFTDTEKTTTILDYKVTFSADAPVPPGPTPPTPTPSKKLGTGAIIGISAGSVAVVAGGGVGVAKGVKSHNLKKKEKEFENKTTKSDDKK